MSVKTDSSFKLDARLENDTFFVIGLPICDVRLMNDARYPWLILVPRIKGAVELVDLDPDTRWKIWAEVDTMALALRQIAPCEKLNIGTLGNVVSQLHLHIVARLTNDFAWPGPVWGVGESQSYTSQNHALFIKKIVQAATMQINGDAP